MLVEQVLQLRIEIGGRATVGRCGVSTLPCFGGRCVFQPWRWASNTGSSKNATGRKAAVRDMRCWGL